MENQRPNMKYCERLAGKLGKHPVYIYNVLAGNERCSGPLAIAIDRETLGLYKKTKLRPDLWPGEDG